MVPLSLAKLVLVEALKSAPCDALGEAISSLLKGVMIPSYGVPCCPCVGGGSATDVGCLTAMYSSYSS